MFTLDPRNKKSLGKQTYGKIDRSYSFIMEKYNYFDHDRQIHGLQEVEKMRLKVAIRKQYILGDEGLQILDKYLFNNIMLKLWAENGSLYELG